MRNQGIRDWGSGIGSGRGKAEGGRWKVGGQSGSPRSANPQSLISNPFRPAFTLVEMLVTISIIGVLAGMVMATMQVVRQAGREATTKATIAKLHAIIMERYESYLTRRVPITIPPGTPPALAAQMRLDCLRDLMRMEMPERWVDVEHLPTPFPSITKTISGTPYSTGPYGIATQPALHQLYRAKYAAQNPNGNDSHAKLLYMIVSTSNPEAMEQFSASEIAVDTDGWPYFVDGWGKPIYFLRWAPGFVAPLSDLQTGNPTTDHDPFDTRKVDTAAFQLVPLIFSFGRTSSPNINVAATAYYGNTAGTSTWDHMNPYSNLTIGALADPSGRGNITNHNIEAR
jgi:prepilin-type N-terminal cleavage/methylation domain-containing protein